jgi:hypothetical protein
LTSIYEKCRQIKQTGEEGKWEGERDRENGFRGEREVALVERGNGVG